MTSSWASGKLREVFTIKYGKGLPEEKRISGGQFKVFGSNGPVGNHDQPLTAAETIIIGRKGSVGAVHYSPEPCWPIDTTFYIDEFPCGLPAIYWAYYLRSLRLGQHDKSSAIPGVGRGDIYDIEVPLPSIDEQRRIVAKLEKLLAKVDACKERLEKIPAILKRFRQSVLAAACSGRLTADWRNGLNEWVDSKIGDVVLDLSNGFSKRFGSHGEEVTVLRLSDFSGRQRIYGKERQIRLTKEEREKYTLDKGDILVVRVNGSREIAGRFILYESKQEAYCDHFIRIKVDCNRIQPRFLTYAMDTNSSRVLIENSLVTSAGQNTINQKALSSIPVSLPPLEEQHEIVRRVEALFKIADHIEKRYQKAKTHVDKLTQSILAKAFRGELVPQDPNDEPASELLKRIQAERKNQEAEARPGRKSAKRRMRN
jgi:type I restriction enzyme S subunit